MDNILTQVDLAFVVDTTGSMGSFITTARQQMTAMLRSVAGEGDVRPDLRVAVVEYRDHPPQDRSFVARPHDFMTDLGRVEKVIAGLQPAGGGDAPEAVYDGLSAACDQLTWRPHARRVAVLVGDAPPHVNCKCGQTAESVTGLLEQKGVTLYALGLTASVKGHFDRLAVFTGGAYFEPGQGQKAIDAVQSLLRAEFDGLAFDRQVLEVCRGADWSVDGVSEALSAGRGRVASSLDRLGRRGLLVNVK